MLDRKEIVLKKLLKSFVNIHRQKQNTRGISIDLDILQITRRIRRSKAQKKNNQISKKAITLNLKKLVFI